jgi:hypothetical protein
MNIPTALPTLLLILSTFAAGALAGVVLLSCWLRAIQRRLAADAVERARERASWRKQGWGSRP